MEKVNAWLNKVGLKITSAVSTMWCAIAFAGIAFVSLPGAIASHNTVTIISWVAQTFLQLVLLSIIMVGQSLQSQAAEDHLEKILKHISRSDDQILKLLRKKK